MLLLLIAHWLELTQLIASTFKESLEKSFLTQWPKTQLTLLGGGEGWEWAVGEKGVGGRKGSVIKGTK